MTQGIGYYNAGPLEDGAIKTIIQDQTTPPWVGFFVQNISPFSLAIPTQESTLTTIYRTATLTAGHGLITGDQIILIDTVASRTFYAFVTNVATNVVTVDKPIDHAFPVTAVCSKVTRNMNVNGAVTPQIYSATPIGVPADLYGINILMGTSTSPDDGKFGGLAKLTNGVCIRVINGENRTIGCAKTNGEMRSFGSANNPYSDKGSGGTYGVNIYIPIRNEWGVPLRIQPGGYIQTIVQDDISGLTDAYMTYVGQYTSGELMV